MSKRYKQLYLKPLQDDKLIDGYVNTRCIDTETIDISISIMPFIRHFISNHLSLTKLELYYYNDDDNIYTPSLMYYYINNMAYGESLNYYEFKTIISLTIKFSFNTSPISINYEL